jgi:hypothetical protein
MKKTYEIVMSIVNSSGFTYSEEKGADITAASQSAWAAFVEVYYSL